MKPRRERLIAFMGHELLPAQWGVLAQIPPSAIAQRIARGWDPIRAITTLQYGLPGLPRGIAEIIAGKSPEQVLLEMGKDWRGKPIHPDYAREARARLERAGRRVSGGRRASGWRDVRELAEEFFDREQADDDHERDPASSAE